MDGSAGLQSARRRAPRPAERSHTATPPASRRLAVLDHGRRGRSGDRGIALSVRKGLPLCGGQGGSAASAVAGAVAVNALLGAPLDRHALLEACLVAEETVAGRHLDNIAPSLLGGIVLIRSIDPIDIVQLPVPDELRRRAGASRPASCARRKARSVLPADVPARGRAASGGTGGRARRRARERTTTRCSAARSTTASPSRRARRCCRDFAEAKAAALDAGALGSSISGSGPDGVRAGRGRSRRALAAAMVAAYAARGMPSAARVARVDREGARLVETEASQDHEIPDRAPGQLAGAASPAATRRPSSIRARAAPSAAGCSKCAIAPPDVTREELLQQFTERRGQRPGRHRPRASGASANSSCPSADRRGHPPRGQHAAAPPRRARPVGRSAIASCSSTRDTTPPDRSRTAG